MRYVTEEGEAGNAEVGAGSLIGTRLKELTISAKDVEARGFLEWFSTIGMTRFAPNAYNNKNVDTGRIPSGRQIIAASGTIPHAAAIAAYCGGELAANRIVSNVQGTLKIEVVLDVVKNIDSWAIAKKIVEACESEEARVAIITITEKS